MSEAMKLNELAYAGTKGAGADECIVMISINGHTATPVGRNGIPHPNPHCTPA